MLNLVVGHELNEAIVVACFGVRGAINASYW
jgi:hypothetical protein